MPVNLASIRQSIEESVEERIGAVKLTILISLKMKIDEQDQDEKIDLYTDDED